MPITKNTINNTINIKDYLGENRKFSVAVVGATGSIGSTILHLLAERNFPIREIYAVASERSTGKSLQFGGREITVQNLENFDFSRCDIAIFSVGSKLSAQYTTKATARGCIVIDNSSCWRMDDRVPLVVASINSQEISQYKNKNIIATPNCIAVPIADVLSQLHSSYNISRVIASTYQSVSGRGNAAIQQLYEETRDEYFSDEENEEVKNDMEYMRPSGQEFDYKNYNKNQEDDDNSNEEDYIEKPLCLPHKIAFNVIPQVGNFLKNGETDEEEKIRNEIGKIISPQIKVSATCVRVPVFFGHSISLNVELSGVEKIPPIEEIAEIIRKNNDVAVSHEILEDADGEYYTNYVMPIDCISLPLVYVSRLRPDQSNPKAVNMWIVSDNLYKGTALNAVQIAEKLISNYF